MLESNHEDFLLEKIENGKIRIKNYTIYFQTLGLFEVTMNNCSIIMESVFTMFLII